ncbi:MAG: AsmA-like C-terminal region-containing protein [Cytophagales bacterium]
MKSTKGNIGFIVFICLILGGILGYSSLPYFFDNIIKLEIKNIINESLHGRATFSKIKISPYNDLPYLNIVLDSVLVQDSILKKSDTLFTANQISFSISLHDWIFDHKYVVRKVSFYLPIIKITKFKNNTDNFSYLFEGETTKAKADTSKFNFKINEISINNGIIYYRDQLEKTTIISENLNLNGEIDISNKAKNLKIVFDTDDFVLKYKNITYLYKNNIRADLVLDFNNEEKSIAFNNHNIQIDYFQFGFAGFVKQLSDTLCLDIKFQTKNSELKNAISLIPGIYKKDYDKFKAKGHFSLEAEIKGYYNAKKSLSPSYFAHFTLNDGEFQYNHLPQPISEIAMDLKYEKLDSTTEPIFKINKFHAKLDSNFVTATVTVVGVQKPFISGTINSALELHELDQYFKIDSITMAGHLAANLTVNGVYDFEISKFPMIDGRVLLSKGYFKRDGFDHAVQNIEMETVLANTTGFMENTSLQLKKLNLNIDDEYLEMYGKMEDFKKYKFDLFLRSEIDLMNLNSLLHIENQTLTGIVATKIIAKGSADKFKEAYVSGTASLKDVHIADTEADIDLKIKKGNVVFSPEMIILSNFEMNFKKERFLLNGIFRNYIPYFNKEKTSLQASIRIQADSLNLDHFITQKEAKKGIDIADSTLKKMPSPYKKSGFDALENISLDLALKANWLKYDKYNLYNVKTALKADAKQIVVEKLAFNSLDASFSIANTQISPINFNFNFDVKELDTRKLMKFFTEAKTDTNILQDETGAVLAIKYKLKGDFDGDFKPILNSLNGYGMVSVDKANIKGLKVLSHISKASEKDDIQNQEMIDAIILTEIKDGKVNIKPFTILLGKYLTSIEGSHTFNNEINYFVKVGIPPFHKIKIPMQITGTIDKPLVSLTKRKNQ